MNMSDNRKRFLEKQINLYAELIEKLENSNINQKEKKDLLNIRELYTKYNCEYQDLLVLNQ